jgi:excisionase family DNA binding protein
MSSNIRITRICEHCGKAFEARKTTSTVCSHPCAQRAYKARKRAEKIATSNEQTRKVIEKPITDLRAHEFLTVEESAKLVRISRRTLYRLIERGELPVTKLSRRTVIRRADIEKLFEPPTPAPKADEVAAPVDLADCYTLKEVMEKYSISEAALHSVITRNQIPRQRKGWYTYVPKAIIDALLMSNPTNA